MYNITLTYLLSVKFLKEIVGTLL